MTQNGRSPENGVTGGEMALGYPPTSNKGGNEYNPRKSKLPLIACNLDWIRYTARWRGDLSEADNLRAALPQFVQFALTGEMTQHGRGYNRAMKLTHGVIHWHTENQSQGISVELGGAVLGAVRVAGVTDRDILIHIGAIQGRVSTMDTALDLYNLKAEPMDIIRARDDGSIDTTARNIGTYESSTLIAGTWHAGDTVYIGSAKSDRQIRVYHKAIEVGQRFRDWVRMEMRWRDNFARSAHAAMVNQDVASTTRSAIQSMFKIQAQWYALAIAGDLADIEPTRRKETNTRDWLIAIVLPVLERELKAEAREGGSKLAEAAVEAVKVVL